MLLSGKICIVTGGSAGIGKEIVKTFIENGAEKVIIFDMDEVLGNNTGKELGRDKIDFEKVNVCNFKDVEEKLKNVIDKYKKLDVIINNAGITRDNLIMRMTDEEWDSVISVNLKGVFNCIKAVSRYMLKQRAGKIVNIASIAGVIGNTGQANYSASKGGVISLTKTTAKEFASRNINVNAIAPGFINTRMTEKLSEEIKQKYLNVIPFQRFGDPKDIAKVALFLSSELSDYVTGQVIIVDGGMVM